ncbi:MAG: phosphoglycerate kinase [Patescibacteria group bacterium]|nr:phosphoglycerate kinase [Patescibacteria group bacterium]
MKLKVINDIQQIKGKTVFLRVDFNVPRVKTKIKDETKILAALPTIRFLLRYRCRVILATHLGEPSLRTASASAKVTADKSAGKPEGKKIPQLSCKFLAKRLNQILGGNRVKFVAAAVGKEADQAIKALKPGKIIFLENLRFNRGEEKNDRAFARELSRSADIYVNEAFSVCHRAHASVSAIRRFLPSFAGLLLEKEIFNLDQIKKPVKPLIILMGGAKIKTKIKLIKNLQDKAAKILIGGALANNFFKAMGMNVGRSLVDKESVAIAQKLLSDKKIVLPLDVVVNHRGSALVKLIDDIGAKDIVFDIGPRTIMLFSTLIKKAKTIVWNGPLGAFEQRHYRYGTMALGELIAARSRGKTFGVVGGGETLEALKMTKMEGYVDWISTGGGAMLAYLGGERMPGLE